MSTIRKTSIDTHSANLGIIIPLGFTHKNSPLLIVDAGQISMDNSMVGGQVQGSKICCNSPRGRDTKNMSIFLWQRIQIKGKTNLHNEKLPPPTLFPGVQKVMKVLWKAYNEG